MPTVRNIRNGRTLASTVRDAATFVARLRGLIRRASLPPGEALRIRPCRGIHSIGMRFAFDAVFLNRRHSVVALRERIAPNRICAPCLAAHSVLELPAGTIAETGTIIGDVLEFSDVPSARPDIRGYRYR